MKNRNIILFVFYSCLLPILIGFNRYFSFRLAGAFLVTYGVAMVLCGIPIFFQEVAIGQYLGAGGMTLVGQLCPILKGESGVIATAVSLVSLSSLKVLAYNYLPVLRLQMTKTMYYVYAAIMRGRTVKIVTKNLNIQSSCEI